MNLANAAREVIRLSRGFTSAEAAVPRDDIPGYAYIGRQ